AKAMLRALVFQSHKGVYRISFFAPQCGPDLAILPQAFFEQVKKDGFQLTDAGRALVGPQLQAVRRMTSFLAARGQPLDVGRKLEVQKVIEHDPRLVFKGDGTSMRPDRYHRDDLAILPFQLDDRRFAIAIYVVTQDLAKTWDESKDLLDPHRYDMPDQTFDIEFGNLRGKNAKVSAYDPLRDQYTPVALMAGDENTAAVRMAVSDSPRFLVFEEEKPGPLLADVKIKPLPSGGAEISFRPNCDGTAVVTWGPYPERKQPAIAGEWKPGCLLGEYYNRVRMAPQDQVALRRMDGPIDFEWKQSPGEGVNPDHFGVRWTGFIVPAFSEEYTFTTIADDNARLWINGALVIEDWGQGHGPAPKSGTCKLEAEKPVPLRLEFADYGGSASLAASAVGTDVVFACNAWRAAQRMAAQPAAAPLYFYEFRDRT
ncbi:MAG: PA14 domain-containing protein, partial [Planctomycetota bacterium]|nr:PA14 domain-containing protein [Planctomycetota bacterium]